MSFRFVHAADLHLDTPFKGFHPAPPAVAETLRDASLHALDALIDLAIDRQAAFVILAGDLYDGPEHGIRAQVALRTGLERLSSAGIACFLVHGNHDPIEAGWSAIPTWPHGVTLFGADEVGSVAVERDGATLATVHGISFAAGATPGNLVLRFRRPETPGFHIGVLHCAVTDADPEPPVSPCTLTDLEQAGFDYWALGHRHERQVLRQGEQWIVYPGTTQGRRARPSEHGPKGALVVEVKDGAARTPEFVALDHVRIAEVEVTVDGLRDLIDVRQVLQAAADDQTRAAGGRPLVLQATLSGGGPAADEIRNDGGRAGLLQYLRDGARLDPPFVWWDHLQDATHPNLDLDGIRGRGDFPAEVLLTAARLTADRDALGAFAQRHLGALRSPTQVRFGDDLPDPAVPERWQETVGLALTLLAAVER